MSNKAKAAITQGSTNPIESIALELQSYFDAALTEFKAPIHLLDSTFQILVCEGFVNIPYGSQLTYAAQVRAIEKRTTYRAVANANSANHLAIVSFHVTVSL